MVMVILTSALETLSLPKVFCLAATAELAKQASLMLVQTFGYSDCHATAHLPIWLPSQQDPAGRYLA
jgi:hypothetical protein